MNRNSLAVAVDGRGRVARLNPVRSAVLAPNWKPSYVPAANVTRLPVLSHQLSGARGLPARSWTAAVSVTL
jgi:hypothetical protein